VIERFPSGYDLFVAARSLRGVSLLRPEKSLVSEAIDQESFTTTSAFHAFLPCRAAVVVPGPSPSCGNHSSPPDLDRVVLVEAESRAAALLVGPGVPAQRHPQELRCQAAVEDGGGFPKWPQAGPRG
jgi:hypothetical protein